MKPITIHPGSALAGAALAAVSLLASSAVQTTTHSSIPAPWRDPIRVVGIPDPRDMVLIKEGQPFIVPPGRTFVLTGMGHVVSDGQPGADHGTDRQRRDRNRP